MKILISLATYNERENLPILVEEIFWFAPDVDILVVDDNSPDGTGDWVAEQMGHEPRLKLIRRSVKLGLGTATLAAMQYAIEHDYAFLLNMDADLSHSPQYLAAIRSKADEGFDVVIGSRYVQGGGVEGWPFVRRWMSRSINLYAKLLLGLKTQDNSGSFRCYRTEILKKLDPEKIISQGYSFLEEVLFRLHQAGATFAEVPIIFAERRHGTSKINAKEALRALGVLLRLAVARVWGIGHLVVSLYYTSFWYWSI